MNPISNASLRMQLLGGTLVIAAIFMITLAFGLYATLSINRQFNAFIDEDVSRLRHLQMMQAEGAQVVIAAAKKIMVPELEPPLRVANTAVERFDDSLASVRLLYDEVSEGRASMRRIEQIWQRVRGDAVETIRLVDQAEVEQAKRLFLDQVQSDWGAARKELQPLILAEEAAVAQTRDRVQGEVRGVLAIGFVVSAIAVLAALVLSLVFSKVMSRGICRAAIGLREIAEGEGDLTRRLPDHGVREMRMLANGFNTFVAKTQGIVARIGDSAQAMSGVVANLSGVASTMRSNADQQHDATTQVATAMTQMTSTIQEIAQSAQSAADAADEAGGRAHDGDRVVSSTVHSINELAANVERAAGTMSELEEATSKVGMVLTVIQGIAEQTNLLALNAAIEAARAGEQGRGFAVVADEVRTLAFKTQESTKEITGIIEQLQSGAQSTARIMAVSREKAGATIDDAAQVTETFDQIRDSIARIRDLNAAVAVAAEQQAAAANEIERNTVNLSDLADGSRQSAASADEMGMRLSQISDELTSLVAMFRV